MNRYLEDVAVKDMGLWISKSIGNKAWRALLEEVYTTPKPGLVDLYSCGAHSDMDVSTFEKSALALRPYFIRMSVLGYVMRGCPEELFKKLRIIGLEAERAMYHATGGVNTHKGLIFTLGIFCAAAGRCIWEKGKITKEELWDVEQRMTVRILTEEVRTLQIKEAVSHGEQNLKDYGSMGVRGEAIEGYQAIWKVALPVLQRGILEKRDWNLVKLQTLLALMSKVEDSNILSRKNPVTLHQVHLQIKSFLEKGGAYSQNALVVLKKMDADYICQNISAGGCADLLAATIFIESLLNI